MASSIGILKFVFCFETADSFDVFSFLRLVKRLKQVDGQIWSTVVFFHSLLAWFLLLFLLILSSFLLLAVFLNDPIFCTTSRNTKLRLPSQLKLIPTRVGVCAVYLKNRVESCKNLFYRNRLVISLPFLVGSKSERFGMKTTLKTKNHNFKWNFNTSSSKLCFYVRFRPIFSIHTTFLFFQNCPHNTILLTSMHFLYIFPVCQRNKKSQFITKCKQTCGRERKDSSPFVRKCKPRFVVTPPNNTKQVVL